tara:strand:+ start:10117 stop:11589 length:1473 start_codon:yes stop_codon:yes gene_type:complete
MAGAFVDGALKGFEMMERYQSNQDNKARLADMDKRNEQRYQDGLDRQAQLDKERKDNREQDVTYRKDQAKATADYRKSTLEANQLQRTWQQNYQTQQANWKKDQPAIAMAWQTYRDTGTIPKELEEVMQRNKAMDPRTYTKPEVRENIKMFDSFLGDVAKTGKISEMNSPRALELTNAAFSDKLNSTIGQYDESVKSKVANNRIVNYVPLSEPGEPVRFGFELEITYENGMKERKSMTKGRTSEPDDPVMTYTPKELFATIKTRAMMADMMERPEYWDKMGAQIGAQIGARFGGKGGESKADYQKKLGALQDDMTKAFAKIQSDSSLGASDEERQQAVERVKNIYLQRIDQLNKAYGIKSEGEQKGDEPKAGEASGNNGNAERAKVKEDLANSILNGTSSGTPAPSSNSNSKLAEPGFFNGLRDGIGGKYKNEAKPIDYSDMSHLDSVLTQTGQTLGSVPGTLGDIGEYIGDEAISPALDWLTKKPSEKK